MDYLMDSEWNEAKLKFLRLHLCQMSYNRAYVEGDFITALHHLDIIKQEIWGHTKKPEKEELNKRRNAVRNLTQGKRVSPNLIRIKLEDYSNYLFEIRTERKMDLPKKADPGKALENA